MEVRVNANFEKGPLYINFYFRNLIYHIFFNVTKYNDTLRAKSVNIWKQILTEKIRFLELYFEKGYFSEV